MRRNFKIITEWLELFRSVVRIRLFYVYILARIWLLNHARNDSGLFLHLDKCHAKVYI